MHYSLLVAVDKLRKAVNSKAQETMKQKINTGMVKKSVKKMLINNEVFSLLFISICQNVKII